MPGRSRIKEKRTILGKHIVEQFSLTETGQIPVIDEVDEAARLRPNMCS